MKKILFIGFLVGLSLYGFTQKQIKQYEYWFDNSYQTKTAINITPTISHILNATIPTSGLPEGLHTFRIRFQDVYGVWSTTDNQFFIKLPLNLPIGENKISGYRYWLDKDFSNQKTVKVTTLVNPLVFNNLIINIPPPAKATPNNYEFYPNPSTGDKITYHSQFLFYSQFKDLTDKWSRVTADSVLQPYSVIIRCDSLSRGISVVKDYPKVDTIHFFKSKVEVGDSLVFKSSQPLIIDMFDPAGKKINTISKEESINDNGFHALLDGEYYALVHGFNTANTISYTLHYSHYPKFCVLKYNRKIVKNNGTDTITFKGNGFSKITKFSLKSGGNTVAGENILCNYLTVVKAGFTFVNTPVGLYDIYVNYGDTTIVIEKGLEVVSSFMQTVLFGDVSMPKKGNYSFAGVYEYDNLIIDEGTSLLSYGISQLVIKVKGKLQIGKDVVIRVRNGYYDNDPYNPTSNIIKENLRFYASYFEDGYSLYPNTYGRGGDGGNGADGGNGYDIPQLLGCGGSGGGGGGGGFGGGFGGNGGLYGIGSGGIGMDGGYGYANGGRGGFGGFNSILSTGGGAVNIGSSPANSSIILRGGGGGAGGGGNGGDGAKSGLALGDDGWGGAGGGGGGYGGGILLISANEITSDPISKPLFFPLGQKGGNGGEGGGRFPVNGSDGKSGEDGLLIINTPNQVPNFVSSTDAYGSNSSPQIGGHGLVSGVAKVFYNVDISPNSIKNVSSTINSGLTIYPNPANDKVNLKTTADLYSKIIICSLTGERIKIVNVFKPITEVDISNLPKGIYLIRLETKEGSNIGKLIKK